MPNTHLTSGSSLGAPQPLHKQVLRALSSNWPSNVIPEFNISTLDHILQPLLRLLKPFSTHSQNDLLEEFFRNKSDIKTLQWVCLYSHVCVLLSMPCLWILLYMVTWLVFYLWESFIQHLFNHSTNILSTYQVNPLSRALCGYQTVQHVTMRVVSRPVSRLLRRLTHHQFVYSAPALCPLHSFLYLN